MSFKKHAHHIPHSLSLVGIIALTIIGITIFSYDNLFQSAIAVGASVSYFVWGIVHHSLHKNLQPIIVFEYFAVSALGLVILLSLLKMI